MEDVQNQLKEELEEKLSVHNADEVSQDKLLAELKKMELQLEEEFKTHVQYLLKENPYVNTSMKRPSWNIYCTKNKNELTFSFKENSIREYSLMELEDILRSVYQGDGIDLNLPGLDNIETFDKEKILDVFVHTGWDPALITLKLWPTGEL